jgi:hypothetical protein
MTVAEQGAGPSGDQRAPSAGVLGVFCAVVGVLTGACMPPTPPDDGFRAMLAAGCKSDAECSALSQRAQDRMAECVRLANGYSRRCSERNEDLERARAMKYEVSARGRTDLAHDEQQRNDAEDAAALTTREEVARLGSSCADVAALGKAAVARSRDRVRYSGPTAAEEYRSLAARRRSERVGSIGPDIRRQIQLTRPTTEMDPAATRGKISTIKALLEDLRCYDESAAAKIQADVDSWAAALEQAVSDEESCRTTPRCMAARIAIPLCEAITSRREALQSIATERRNPAGVVDLNTLHDLGQRVQDADATIAQLRTTYTATTRTQFNEASCRASECCVLLRELSVARDLKKQGDALVTDAMRKRYTKAATKCEAGAFVEMRSFTTGLSTPNKCDRL